MAEKQTTKRTVLGRVISDKMDKTIVVEVVRQERHKLYKKFIKRAKKYHAHDAENSCGIGDTVRIVESRPYSKSKTWELLELVERAK